MKCQTPDCIGEHEQRGISHSVIYRQRTVVVHNVPAHVCPECGDAVLIEETTIHLEGPAAAQGAVEGHGVRLRGLTPAATPGRFSRTLPVIRRQERFRCVPQRSPF